TPFAVAVIAGMIAVNDRHVPRTDAKAEVGSLRGNRDREGCPQCGEGNKLFHGLTPFDWSNDRSTGRTGPYARETGATALNGAWFRNSPRVHGKRASLRPCCAFALRDGSWRLRWDLAFWSRSQRRRTGLARATMFRAMIRMLRVPECVRDISFRSAKSFRALQ